MKSLWIFIIAFWICAPAGATSVRPPSFDELVGSSELVFRGEVKGVRCAWRGDGLDRHIATLVTFQVERVLKGAFPATLTLEFMGGRLDGQKLEIAGLPRFVVGERGVYFVENRAGRLCPLMRLRHGRYRVVTEEGGGVERLLRDDGSALRDVGAMSQALAEETGPAKAAMMGDSMTLAEFEGRVIQRAAEMGAVAPAR